MFRRRALLLLVLGLSFLTFPATAALIDDAGRAKALELALAWVNHNTDRTDVAAPELVTLSPEAMASEAARLGSAGRDAFALYSCAQQTLFVRRDADFDNPLVFSFLVRELVRSAQCRSGDAGTATCEARREPYWAQAKFVRAVPDLFERQGKRLTDAQANFFDGVAVDIDKLADRACGAGSPR